MNIKSIVFQDSLPGYKYMDTLTAAKQTGINDARVMALVIDASKLTGHEYKVGFEALGDSLTWFLKDIVTGYILLKDQLLFDNYTFYNSHNPPTGPVIDGIMLNVVNAPIGIKEWKVTNGSLKWSWINANPSGYSIRGFNGAIGDGYKDWSWLTGRTGISPGRIPHVVIKLADTDTSGNILYPNDPNASYAYRYLRNAQSLSARPEFAPYIKNKGKSYDYQDYTKTLPFAAYNYETGKRLMVGYLENNVPSGTVDGKYWPLNSAYASKANGNSSVSSPREWFFIFDLPYSETPDTSLMVNVYYQSTPMVWFGMPTRNGNAAFSSGDEFLVLKYNQITQDDEFTIKTDYTTTVESNPIPSRFELKQNYPNPFNPTTTIIYSIPEQSNVELKVFDILGREVKTLVRKLQSQGVHSVTFDGTSLPSGIYVYTIRAGEFRDSKKLLLLK